MKSRFLLEIYSCKSIFISEISSFKVPVGSFRPITSFINYFTVICYFFSSSFRASAATCVQYESKLLPLSHFRNFSIAPIKVRLMNVSSLSIPKYIIDSYKNDLNCSDHLNTYLFIIPRCK